MPAVEHLLALELLNPQTVIDVGANKGQFSLAVRYLYPSAKIHAFEPLRAERAVYKSVVSGPAQIHPVALGAKKGSADFFITVNADSSSLLPPARNQTEAYGTLLSTKTSVSVERLSDALSSEELIGPVLLKMDVQGAELQVLEGAEEVLPLIDALYSEVSFVQLYMGQPTASAIISFLERRGFILRGCFNTSFTSRFGPTQSDILFLRR